MSSNDLQSENRGPTFLAPLFLGSVDVVFELDADLPLVGLVPDERVFQKLLCRRTLGVVLHQAALNETEKLFGPVGSYGVQMFNQTLATRETEEEI